MADAKRDANAVPTLIGVSNADGITPVVVWVDPTTHRVLVDQSGSISSPMAFSIFQSNVSVSVQEGLVGLSIPSGWNNLNLSEALASVYVKGITGATTIQIRRSRAGADVDMLSSAISLGNVFTATGTVQNNGNQTVQTGDMIFVDVDTIHTGTAPLGLSVTLTIS
jgi:hypothetical protein